MKNFTFIALMGLLLFTSCKDKPCQDYTNPECENYDKCWSIKQEYKELQADFQKMKDSCLVYYLPLCMQIEGYKNMYDARLGRDDSLKTPYTILVDLGSNINNASLSERNVIEGAARTGNSAIIKDSIVCAYYDANIECLK